MSLLSTPSSLLIPKTSSVNNLNSSPNPKPSSFSLLKPPPFRSVSRRRSPSRTFANRPRFPSFPDGLGGKIGKELGRAADIANDVVSGDPSKVISDVKDATKDAKDDVTEVVSGIFGRRPENSGEDVKSEEVLSGEPGKVISEIKETTTQVAGAPENVNFVIQEITQVAGAPENITGDKSSSEKKVDSGGIISGAGGIISGVVAGAPGKIIGEIKKDTTQVTQIASDVTSGTIGTVSDVISDAPKKVITEIKKETTQVASDVTSGTIGTVSDVISGAGGVVAGAPDKIITEIKKETTQVTQIASDVAGAPGKVADISGAVVSNAPDMVAGEIKRDVNKATQIAGDVISGRPDKLIGDVAGEVGRVGGVVTGVLSGDGAIRKKLDSMELKKKLVDKVVGTNLGFRASSEIRAEVAELVAKLEMVNPNPDPIEDAGLLDGNWVLVYTAYSELLPLLAIGSTPVLKVDKITQDIDTKKQTIENSVTLASGILSFTFSASASFQVQTSSRIQVQFKEAIFKPPEIKPRLDIPDNVEVLGQKIPLNPVQNVLNPVQQVLSPVQDAASSISQSLLGLPSLKLPIPGERTQSWLLISYLDENLRISRGDGGLFVLVKQGTSLLL